MMIEISTIPNVGNYLLASMPMEVLADFEEITACPACDEAERWHVLARLGGRTVAEALQLRACGACGHVTYDRLPPDAWLARYYDGEWDQGRRTRRSAEIKLRPHNPSPWAMSPHVLDLDLPHDTRILDFGCGFGDGLYALQHRGFNNLFGVEPGEHRVGVAGRYFPGHVLRGSVEAAQELARRHGRFDLITMNHVAEHLRRPHEVVKALADLLSEDGILVVSVPHPRSESPIHLPLYLAHLHHYAGASLSRLLQRSGFQTWQWVGSDVQLAVAGSRRVLDGARNYRPGPHTIEPGFIETLARYVRAPWQSALPAGDGVILNYFHPWSSARRDPGFRRLEGAAARWYGGALGRALPWILRAEQSGVDRHNLLRRGLIKASKVMLGSAAPDGGDLLRYRVVNAEEDVPWFVDRARGLPVLGK